MSSVRDNVDAGTPRGTFGISLHIDPRRARGTLVGVVVLLAALDTALKIAQWKLGHDTVFGLIRYMSLAREQSFPTWYASLQLSVAGMVLGYIAWRKLQARERNGIAWCILSAGFFFMSVDETMALHEDLGNSLPVWVPRGGLLYFGWVAFAIPLCLVLLVFFWRLLMSLSARTRVAWLACAAVFTGGALGVEMIGGYFVSAGAIRPDSFGYDMFNVAENAMELLGIALFIPELLRHINHEMSAAPSP